MKFLCTVLLAAGIIKASPTHLVARQFGFGGTGTTANEFVDDGCKDIIFFFARGSTETGNMGATVGPPTADGLKNKYGKDAVAVQGIDYAASLGTNANPGGADYAGIAEMQQLLDEANSQCPDSLVVASGYSQGAALVHRAIEDRSDAVKNQIVGVATYGDTQNVQDNGQIPDFPKDKVLIICNDGDLVCEGTLVVAGPHLAYTSRTQEAVDFLVEKIDAALTA